MNAGIDDVVVSGRDDSDPENWKYLSDVMGEYHLSASQPLNAADGKACPLYVDYRKSCEALQKREAELAAAD